MVKLSCSDRGRAASGSDLQSRSGGLRKIYLARHSERLFQDAVQLLGEAVISYRASQGWISVREDEYLRAVVLLKNHGIGTEIGSD